MNPPIHEFKLLQNVFYSLSNEKTIGNDTPLTRLSDLYAAFWFRVLMSRTGQ